MLKKMLEDQTKILPLELRECVDSQESRENPNPIRQREDREVEILEGTEKIPPLGPIPREESGRGYGERREDVGKERRGADLDRKGAGFEREMDNYDQRGVEFERGGVCYDPRGAKFERRM
ncbi:hypothetical protein M5K25_002173 [Dendrobium thyrsiflorum]|uniref:Uncharacterized protein n=1 Tax=Dendrobium thyrsiflorum TaxID=117978 RepID=A0ABD0VSR7_DENTH